MKVLVIVPAFNEEGSVVQTIDELRNTVPEIDYVVVNDGSRDATAFLCKKHGFNVINQPVNLGLTGAFQTGMKYAYRHGYDIALQFDADGQHVPTFISTIVETMNREKADIVIASRFVTEKKPTSARMMGSNLISALIKITTGKQINDPTSGMRAYNRKMIKEFATRPDLSPEPDTLAFLVRKRHARVCECQVTMRERTAGQSYLTPLKSISYMLNACTSILFAQWFRR